MKATLVILIFVILGAAWHYLPASHHRAPTGTYFVRDSISFATPNGMTGWPPGQEIREVLRASYVEGMKTVTDGTYIASVPAAALTQDVEDAEEMRLAETTGQAQTRSNLAALKVRHDQQQHTAQLDAAQRIDLANADQAAASAVGASYTRLYEPTRFMGGGYVGGYHGYYTTVIVAPPARRVVDRQVSVYDRPKPAAAPSPKPTPFVPSSLGTYR